MSIKTKNPTRLTIRKNARRLIKAYLIVLFLASLTIAVLLSEFNPSELIIKLHSIAVSILGSCVYYTRKIYKCEIREEFIEPDVNSPFCQQESGAILYYILRPIIASTFGFLLFIASYAQLSFVSGGNSIDLHNFSSFIIISSFVIGYSIGDMLDKFEIFSKNRVNNLLYRFQHRDHHSASNDNDNQ